MKPRAAVLITEHVGRENNGVFLSDIVMDDDTTIMAQLQNKRKGGKLDGTFVTPIKRGDVNHRVRGFGNKCNKLATI
eukprot:5048940-Ditylum_brightwellii.AAC.1